MFYEWLKKMFNNENIDVNDFTEEQFDELVELFEREREVV